MQHTAEDIILEEKRFFVMQIGCRVTSHFTFYGTIYIYIYIYTGGREREREIKMRETTWQAFRRKLFCSLFSCCTCIHEWLNNSMRCSRSGFNAWLSLGGITRLLLADILQIEEGKEDKCHAIPLSHAIQRININIVLLFF